MVSKNNGQISFDELSFRLQLDNEVGKFILSKYGKICASVTVYSSDNLRLSIPIEEERATILFNKYFHGMHGYGPKDSRANGKYYADDEKQPFNSGTLILSGWYLER